MTDEIECSRLLQRLCLDAAGALYGALDLSGPHRAGMQAAAREAVRRTTLVDAAASPYRLLVDELVTRRDEPAAVELHHWLLDTTTLTIQGGWDVAAWRDFLFRMRFSPTPPVITIADGRNLVQLVAEALAAQSRLPAFQDACRAIEDRFELSEWDIAVHTACGFNYFDDNGANPFLLLENACACRDLLRFARTWPAFRVETFPFEALRAAASAWWREETAAPAVNGVREVPDIRSLWRLRRD